MRSVTCRRHVGGLAVAARGGAHSLGLALSLASPAPFGPPTPWSPACGSVCEAGGERRGVGVGLPVPGDPRREAEAARDSEKPWTSRGCRRRLKVGVAAAFPSSSPWGRVAPGAGLGAGAGALPGPHPPPASLGSGALRAAPSRRSWALCPPPASRLGEGSRELASGALDPVPLLWALAQFSSGPVRQASS